MKHFLIFATMTMGLTLNAFADGVTAAAVVPPEGARAGSEFYHQADPGKFEIIPAITVGSNKISYNSTVVNTQLNFTFTSQTDNFSNYSVRAEYGFNQMFAIGLKLGTQNESIGAGGGATSQTGKGMIDPSIYLLGRSDLGSGSLHFGGNLSVATTTATTDVNNNFNEATGGTTLTPYIGYEQNFSSGYVGAKLAYDLYQSNRTINSQAVTGTLNAGNVLTVVGYFESIISQSTLVGLSAGIAQSSQTKFVSGGVTTNDSDGVTTLVAALYANFEVAPNIYILPKVGIGSFPGLNYNTTGQNGISGSYGTLAARFAF